MESMTDGSSFACQGEERGKRSAGVRYHSSCRRFTSDATPTSVAAGVPVASASVAGVAAAAAAAGVTASSGSP